MKAFRALLFTLGVLLCLPVQSFAGWTLVANAKASNTAGSAATTSSINSTGGTIILVFAETQSTGGAFSTITDSKGNTWLTAVHRFGASNDSAQINYCQSPCIVGTGHTFTATPGGGYPTIMVAVFGGFSGWTIDQTNSKDAGQPAGGVQPGSITPTGVNRLIFSAAVCYDNTATSPAVNSSFTLLDANSFINGIQQSTWDGYYFQPDGGGSVNPTFSGTGVAGDRIGLIVSFSAPSANPAVPFTFTAQKYKKPWRIAA